MNSGTNSNLPLALSIIDVIENKVQIRDWEVWWSRYITTFSNETGFTIR